jgi:hypothetical protein
MKKIVVGFILGVVTSLSFTAFAVNSDIFTAQKASFEVFVDGKRFESENPTIVVEGRTYLPLKETGDTLGVNVQWNNDLRRVDIEKEQESEVTSEMPLTKPQNKVFNKVFKEVKIIPGDLYLEEVNGEKYISIGAVGQENITREDDKWYITIPDKKPVLFRNGTEIPAYCIKNAEGRILIKLSVLGLEAEIQGDKIILKHK